MTTKIESIWTDIGTAQVPRSQEQDAFILRRIDPGGRLDIYAGLDSSGLVMIAIGIRRTPPAMHLDSTALDYFRQKRMDGSWLMVLRLRQETLVGVFGRLCQDLLDEMESVADEQALVALFTDRLTLWKKLFHNSDGGLLKDHEIKGLIAELLVLKSMLAGRDRSPEEIVTAWVGPFGADQDFLFGDEAVEVKAVGPSAKAISISSIQQLDCAVPLLVRVVTMRAATPGELNAVDLNALVLKVEGELAPVASVLAAFRTRLLEARYVEHDYYSTIVYQPTTLEEFFVDESFPRLTATNVPHGISSASYCVALDALRNKG